MKIRFVLCPGNIRSRNDGERHYISAEKLIDLYKLNPLECMSYSKARELGLPQDLRYLTPRMDGNYAIPGEPPKTVSAATVEAYKAARDALCNEAKSQLLKLAEDADLLAAMATKFGTSKTYARTALLNPRYISVGPRTNMLGDELGLNLIVFRARGGAWQGGINVPVEALLNGEAFKAWRDKMVCEHKAGLAKSEKYIIDHARLSLSAYKRLPASTRKANPLF